MSECSALRETMPLLLSESLDPVQRELTHQHIERCAACADEWNAYRETWRIMDDLPVVEVPARVRERFLAAAGIATQPAAANVVPFHRRPAFKWLAQAAAVAVLVGGGWFAGRETAPVFTPQEATIERVTPRPLAIAETRVVDATAISPEIEGRPNIANVQCLDCDPSDNEISLAFDITSRWTVSGSPNEKGMERLVSYMIENESTIAPRSSSLELVRQAYVSRTTASPEIAGALAKVLRSDKHEGVRIRAVDTLTTMPARAGVSSTRDALIEALKSDPNPAVRLKAVEALAALAQSGTLDAEAVDTLRRKATQQDENLYVRMKAAEALQNVKPGR